MMDATDFEWTLPCEMHQIEPGIIFSLTHRDGPSCQAVGKYPAPPFNDIYHRNTVITPPTVPCPVDTAVSASSTHQVDSNNNDDQKVDETQSASNTNAENDKSSNRNQEDGTKCSEEQKSMEEPLTILNQPLYVNPKQYHRILRRREIRTQLRNKLIRENRMQTLYKIGQGKKQIRFKSRHAQAKRRPRGPGGQFLSKEKEQQKREIASAQNKK